ncbi:MAG TPA: nucleotidyltransferase domain-containing protein [Vicinamibacterales bacterium]|nr:nucleotidyltransferase domain-containing protein [Vicinamibacterales bacterium]
MAPTPTLEAVARARGIRLILQFGSSVTGRTHARSDLDLAVLVERHPEPFHAYGELAADLQQCFPGQEVDLAIINRADPLFLKQVMDTARLLYGSPRAFAELKVYAFRRYQDHRRFLDMEREYVRRQIGAAP